MKRLFVGIPATALIIALLTGASSAKTSITVSMWLNNALTSKQMQEIISEYTKKTGVQVKLIYTDWAGYLDKMLAMAASGKIPDVMVLSRAHLPRFAERGLVRPLDDVVKADKIDLKKDLTSYKSGVYKKRFYGFPIWGGPNLLGYNPALFSKAGAVDPNQLVADGRWNWETFVEVGKKISKDINGDGKQDQFLLESLTTWEVDWVGKIRQNGGDVINDDYTKAVIDKPDAIEALNWWVDLANRYHIAPPGGNWLQMETGKTAMGYLWLPEAVNRKELAKKKMDMQITLHPAGKAGYVHVAGACPVTVSKSSKNFKEAYRFAKWFALESTQWKIIGVPASTSTYEKEYQDYLKKYFAHPEVGKTAMIKSDPEPSIHPKSQLISDAYNNILWQVIIGKLSPASGAQKVAVEINKLLSQK